MFNFSSSIWMFKDQFNVNIQPKKKPSTFNHALYTEVLHVCNARTSSSISFSQRLILSCSPYFLQTYSVSLSLSLSLSLSNLTNSKFPIILWTIQNLFSLVVLTTPTYLFITFWLLGITTIRFWFRGNHIINSLAWKQITGSAAKVAWGTVLYSVLLLNLVSLTKNKHYCKCIINFRGWNLPVPIPMVMLLCMSYLCLCFLGFKVFVACLGGAYWGCDFFFGKLSVWLLSFALYFNLIHNISIVLILSLTFHCHVNLVFAVISWIKIADIANGRNKKLVSGKKKKKNFYFDHLSWHQFPSNNITIWTKLIWY